MNTFEIAIQRKLNDIYPVEVIATQSGGRLPVRAQSLLRLDLDELRPLEQSDQYGAMLGDALFQGEIRDAFITAHSVSLNTNEALHIFLRVEAEELRELRWEYLNGPIGGRFAALAQNPGTPLSRYLYSNSKRVFPTVRTNELRALALFAGPEDLPPGFNIPVLDMEQIIEVSLAALGDIPYDLLAHKEGAAGPPTLNALMEHLATGDYTMLFLFCSSRVSRERNETMLFIPEDEQKGRPFTGSTLIDRFSRLPGKLPPLAVITSDTNSVFDSFSARLVSDLGIPTALTIFQRATISDTGAFLKNFFRSLRRSGQADLAVAEGLSTTSLSPNFPIPVLYSRLGGQPLLQDASAGAAEQPLSAREIQFGLQRLEEVTQERAPILQEEVEKLSETIRNFHSRPPASLDANARQERQQAMDRVNTLAQEIGEVSFQNLASGAALPAYDPRCPFRGLEPFRPEDREFFFGREIEVDRIRRRLDEQPFLAVIGASGSGKTSLVLAGLLPAMESPFVVFSPGDVPLASLEAALSQQSEAGLLVVDNFEEVFTQCPNEKDRQEFISRLVDLIRISRVIVILRADFLGECLAYRNLAELIQTSQVLIAPLAAEELRSVIDRQAGQVGLRFEPGLADRMVSEIEGEPGGMALLQHALFALWQRRHGHWLRVDEYQNLGGIRSILGRTADDFYLSLTSLEQSVVREIFLRMVNVGESVPGSSRVTRKKVPIRDLVPAGRDPAQIMQIVNRLGDARLVVVTTDPASNEAEIEIAHEALLASWPRIKSWIEEERGTLRVASLVGEAAREWDSGERSEDLLVHRGARLESALELASSGRYNFNAVELEYLDNCVKAQSKVKPGNLFNQLLERIRPAKKTPATTPAATPSTRLSEQKSPGAGQDTLRETPQQVQQILAGNFPQSEEPEKAVLPPMEAVLQFDAEQQADTTIPGMLEVLNTSAEAWSKGELLQAVVEWNGAGGGTSYYRDLISAELPEYLPADGAFHDIPVFVHLPPTPGAYAITYWVEHPTRGLKSTPAHRDERVSPPPVEKPVSFAIEDTAPSSMDQSNAPESVTGQAQNSGSIISGDVQGSFSMVPGNLTRVDYQTPILLEKVFFTSDIIGGRKGHVSVRAEVVVPQGITDDKLTLESVWQRREGGKLGRVLVRSVGITLPADAGPGFVSIWPDVLVNLPEGPGEYIVRWYLAGNGSEVSNTIKETVHVLAAPKREKTVKVPVAQEIVQEKREEPAPQGIAAGMTSPAGEAAGVPGLIEEEPDTGPSAIPSQPVNVVQEPVSQPESEPRVDNQHVMESPRAAVPPLEESVPTTAPAPSGNGAGSQPGSGSAAASGPPTTARAAPAEASVPPRAAPPPVLLAPTYVPPAVSNNIQVYQGAPLPPKIEGEAVITIEVTKGVTTLTYGKKGGNSANTKGIYRSKTELKKIWLSKEFELGPRAMGEKLFKAIINDNDVEGHSGSSTRIGYNYAMQESGGRLRINLWVEQDLSCYCWEYLKDPDSPIPLTINENTPFTRLYGSQRAGVVPRQVQPLRVLFAISSPVTLGQPRDPDGREVHKAAAGLTPIKVLEEIEAIQKGMEPLASGPDKLLEYDILVGTPDQPLTLDFLSQVVQHGLPESPHPAGYHVLHMIAHGGYMRLNDEDIYILVMERDRQFHQFESIERVRNFLANLGLSMLVLGACKSADQAARSTLAHELVEHCVPAAIAMQRDLPYQVGQLFIRRFYGDLALSGCVDIAMSATRKDLYLMSPDSWNWTTPMLLMRESGSTIQGQLFDVDPANSQVRRPSYKELMSDLAMEAGAAEDAEEEAAEAADAAEAAKAGGTAAGSGAGSGSQSGAGPSAAGSGPAGGGFASTLIITGGGRPTAPPAAPTEPQNCARLDRLERNKKLELKGFKIALGLDPAEETPNPAPGAGAAPAQQEPRPRRPLLELPDSTLGQIVSALNAGKHIILIGPPGTGKTTLAQAICDYARSLNLTGSTTLTTASADWTSFDTVGGYFPAADGSLVFRPGIFLKSIRDASWLVIDEINRAEIDKAFGELFSVLSGQPVELPYKVEGKSVRVLACERDVKKADSQIEWAPRGFQTDFSYVIHPNWRIIGTMNVYDKSSLFQMSFAFMRRFAFIDLDLPRDAEFTTLVDGWLKDKKIEAPASKIPGYFHELLRRETGPGQPENILMARRAIGPAIIRDMVEYIADRARDEANEARRFGEAFLLFVVPQLDGLDYEGIILIYRYISSMFIDLLPADLEQILSRIRLLYPHIPRKEWEPPARQPVQGEQP